MSLSGSSHMLHSFAHVDERSPFGIRLHGSERSPFGIKLHGAAADVTHQRRRLTLDLGRGNHWRAYAFSWRRTFSPRWWTSDWACWRWCNNTTYNKPQRATWGFDFSTFYLLIFAIMSAPSSADVAAFSRQALGRRQVATGLRPLVEALGIAMPPREAASRGSRRGLRHYSKDEYVDALQVAGEDRPAALAVVLDHPELEEAAVDLGADVDHRALRGDLAG